MISSEMKHRLHGLALVSLTTLALTLWSMALGIYCHRSKTFLVEPEADGRDARPFVGRYYLA